MKAFPAFRTVDRSGMKPADTSGSQIINSVFEPEWEQVPPRSTVTKKPSEKAESIDLVITPDDFQVPYHHTTSSKDIKKWLLWLVLATALVVALSHLFKGAELLAIIPLLVLAILVYKISLLKRRWPEDEYR